MTDEETGEKSPLFIIVRGGCVDLVGTNDPDLLDRIRPIIIDLDVNRDADSDGLRHVQVGDPDDDLSWSEEAHIDKPQLLYMDVTIGR